jgi:hypothetical protein
LSTVFDDKTFTTSPTFNYERERDTYHLLMRAAREGATRDILPTIGMLFCMGYPTEQVLKAAHTLQTIWGNVVEDMERTNTKSRPPT